MHEIDRFSIEYLCQGRELSSEFPTKKEPVEEKHRFEYRALFMMKTVFDTLGTFGWCLKEQTNVMFHSTSRFRLSFETLIGKKEASSPE